MKPRYQVSVYDPDTSPFRCDGWRVRYKSVTKWRLRKVLRRLASEGYDRGVSIMVESHASLAKATEAAASLAAHDREEHTGQKELFS